jgi:hypothetical protein
VIRIAEYLRIQPKFAVSLPHERSSPSYSYNSLSIRQSSEELLLFDPWIRDPEWVKKLRSGSGMNTPDYISKSQQKQFYMGCPTPPPHPTSSSLSSIKVQMEDVLPQFTHIL